jgi:hypothetical protein
MISEEEWNKLKETELSNMVYSLMGRVEKLELQVKELSALGFTK